MISYTKYSDPMWKAYKSLPKHAKKNYCFLEFIEEIATTMKERCPTVIDLALETVLLRSGCLWRYAKIDHYFLDEGVAEFCSSSVDKCTRDYFGVLPSTGMVDIPNKDGNPMSTTNGIAFHFPTTDKYMQSSIVVIPKFFFVDQRVSSGSINWEFSATDGSNLVLADPDGKGRNVGDPSPWKHKEDEESKELERLVYGISLYMDAFPDSVVEADNIKKIGHYDGIKKKIRKCEHVSVESERSSSPHWRRGHFRVLTSERYKNKRYQTVFVKGSFVKGRAFQVLADVA